VALSGSMFRTKCPYCDIKINRLANSLGKVDKEESLIFKSKHCPSCNKEIAINIWFPILFCGSFLTLLMSSWLNYQCELPFGFCGVNPVIILGLSLFILSFTLKAYKKKDIDGKTT
jgi:hypothetical protein